MRYTSDLKIRKATDIAVSAPLFQPLCEELFLLKK